VATEAWTLGFEDSRAVERELVDRHRHGDTAAFEEVYARHSGLVYNLCLRLCGNAETAADLAQETFLRVHRHLGRFRGGAALRTWIFRVAVNVCRSRLARSPQPTESLEDALARDEPRSRERDPEESAAAAELGRRIVAALGEVPMPYRIAVVLRDVQGLGYEEIATVLRIPAGTVRSRIARGREALRGRLEADR
jgi:RNA polymerase sigma-70 factor (ECF subfamily)